MMSTARATLPLALVAALQLASASEPPKTDTAVSAQERSTYLMRFVDKPLALFDGTDFEGNAVALPIALPLPKKTLARSGRSRLDTHSLEALAYLAYLDDRQIEHLNHAAALIGRPLYPTRRMQHALDAVAVDLTPGEALALSVLRGVEAIEPEYFEPLQTDIAPAFIGATSVWWNASAGADSILANSFETAGDYGDGVVVGVIDSGYNSASPSFAATDGRGYTIQNPLGAGQFIGQCALPSISVAGCNAKVIGVYDMLDDGSAAHPFSAEDPFGPLYVGHGSITASIAAGNFRTAAYTDPNPFVDPALATYTAKISGIAPHANLVIFRACGDEFTGCSSIATAASVDQAVASGVVDVLNYSISGGTAPWAEATSQAFLSAVNAGIFVAAAAGNTGGDYVNGRVAGTVIHIEPWVLSVAASFHSGGSIMGTPQGAVRNPLTLELPWALPDGLVPFSGMGPAALDILKPDVEAPGSNILAATSSDGSLSGPMAVSLSSGTSMASPHAAGAAALIFERHPDWTPMEIKSALTMTAKENGLTVASLASGSHPSTPFDRGAGRIQPFPASRAGLVLDELGEELLAADPAQGGDVTSLNLPSMQKSICVTTDSPTSSSSSCSFHRRLRSTLDHAVTWTASVSGLPGDITPATIAVNPQGFVRLDIRADVSAFASDGSWHFGEAVLVPDDGGPTLHLPIAVAVPPPTIVAPAAVAIAVPAGANNASAVVSVQNAGGTLLAVSSTNFVQAQPIAHVLIDQPVKSAFPRTSYSSYRPDLGGGLYTAEDILTQDASTKLTKMVFPGVTGGASLATYTGTAMHFRIYPDANGVPASVPFNDPGNQIAAWHFDTSIGAAGLDVSNDTITLDLANAGAPATNLSAGTWWIVVYADIAYGTNGDGWKWLESSAGNGHLPMQSSAPPTIPWLTLSQLSNTTWTGMALHVEDSVACGAPWLSTSPQQMNLGGLLSAPLSIQVDATKFPPGATAVVGYACIQSNDPKHGLVLMRVSAKKN